MADIICRWRNGTPQTVVELVKSLPHKTMPNDEFRLFMNNSIWGSDFFRTPYQLACQLGLYYESDDGYYYPRFDHDIDLHEAQEYLEFWMPRYYVPNPYVGKNGFNGIECPTYMLSELYKYAKNHPNCLYTDAYRAVFHEEANNNNDIVRNYINNFSKVLRFEKNGQLSITDINPNTIFDFMDRNDKKEFFDNFTKKTKTTFDTNIPLQQIFYGAPGTGKSYRIKEIIKGHGVDEKEQVIRTTFHPDSDYSTFVGCYKPISEKSVAQIQQPILDYDSLVDKFKEYLNVPNANITKTCTLFGYDYHDSIVRMQEQGRKIMDLVNDAYKSNTTYDSVVRGGMACYETNPVLEPSSRISYSFVPQAFVQAYTKAWTNPSKPIILVIEEINRGNCAQIFGDIFQLLDRGDDHISEYEIKSDKALENYLRDYFAAIEDVEIPVQIKVGKTMKLPANLYIWATMNTSDQSLFPIDSAFKRRWEWKYIKIARPYKKNEDGTFKTDENGDRIRFNYSIEGGHDWWAFLQQINAIIDKMTNSADKQLGYFFAKAKDDVISYDTFVSKVCFYLWNDIFKTYALEEQQGDLFSYTDNEGKKKQLTFPAFYDGDGNVIKEVAEAFIGNVMRWNSDTKNDK